MLIVMDMSTGRRLEQSCIYGEEVLNAGWLPQLPLQEGLQTSVEVRLPPRQENADAEAVLRNFYLYQQ